MAKKYLTLIINRRLKVAIGILLLIILTGIVLVGLSFTAGAKDKSDLFDESDDHVKDEKGNYPDVITGTQDVDDALRSYMEAHYLSDEERRAMGLDVLLPAATRRLGGFVDACHSLTAATTVAAGAAERLVAEMERILAEGSKGQ